MANETQHGIISFTSYVHITKNKALSGDEKNLLNLLFALSIQLGYSYATNDYLAEIIGKSESSIAILLTRLKAKGLIVITDNSKRNRDRKITIPSLEKFSKHTKKTLDALTPEVETEPLHVSVEEMPNYDRFVPQKKAPKTTNIINVGQIVLSERMRRFASEKGYSDVQTEEVFEHFLNHHLSKGNTFKDWDRAFNTWILNQKSFKKNFSDAPVRKSSPSSSSSIGQRISVENQILSEHPSIERMMMGHNIHIANVMLGITRIPQELAHYALIELRTPKEGLQTYWYDTRKYTKQHDDAITVDVIEYKG